MALRKFWIGTTGPYWYNDADGAFRFETAVGTISLTPLSGQDQDNVDIGGGNINATTIGNNTAAPMTATTFEAGGPATFSNGTLPAVIVGADTSGATEQAYIKVTVGGGTGYVRVFATK